jgi:ribose/xylose/arabinose/galactoside ABC-type transport system permease subunit
MAPSGQSWTSLLPLFWWNQREGGNGSGPHLAGIFFLGVINNGMNILNVPIDVQLIAKGTIIAFALALASRRQ